MTLPKPLTPIAYPTTLEELEALRVFHNRELRPQMIAIHALFPGVLHNSPSRSVMTTQHFPQHLVVSGSEPPTIMTGLEYEMGKHTFATRMPESGTVHRVVPRYSRGVGKDAINGVPELTVIYQKEVNGEFDTFSVKQWRSFHQYFGYKNKTTPAMNLLYEGSKILKGTKFADTPANTEDENYTYGVNLETACMDVPGVAEDGIIISRSALKKLRIFVYETADITFGRNSVPVNLFGDDNEYKIFKDLGEEIRLDGLLMATRPNKDIMGPAMMNSANLREIDHIFDEKLYTRETSVDKETFENRTARGGKVVDIQVTRNPDCPRYLPPTMTKQLDKYAQGLKNYYNDLLSFEFKHTAELRKMNRDARPLFSAELTNILTRARGITGLSSNRFQGPVGHQYRRNQLDEYTVNFVIEHELEPREGWKLTDVCGGKGVIVQIWEDEDMPVDADGNRAEVITSSNSTVARSNWGRAFIPYVAAAGRDVKKRLRAMAGDPRGWNSVEALTLMDEQLFNNLYNMLLQFYAIVSPQQFWFYTQKVVTKEERAEHLFNCLNKEVYLRMPIDNPVNDVDLILHLEEHFPQTYGPVTYKGIGGKVVTTADKVRIAPMYFMLLEKIADDGSSANIGKLQHHAILASQTKAEKYSQNFRHVHTRNTGEAEARLISFYSKTIETMADIHDRSNNPETMFFIGDHLLKAPAPTNIDSVVDRNLIKYDGTRPLQFLQHFAMTQGFKIEYMPEREAFALGMKEHFDVK